MSPRTRTRCTEGIAPSTASSASILLWTSERRPTTGPAAGSGVDAFVSVEEENAQGRRHRNSNEEPEDAAQIAAHHEGDDDQHRAQAHRIAEDLRGDEVV